MIRYGILTLLLGGCFTTGGFAQTARKSENVFYVVMDGFRWQEMFGGAESQLMNSNNGGVRYLEELREGFWRPTREERRRVMMPFVWDVIAKEGQIFGDVSQNCTAMVTNGQKFSYPGYSEMFCGFGDPRIDSNDKAPNPNINTLEFLSSRPGFGGRVSAYATWGVFPSILSSGRNGIRFVVGWKPMQGNSMTPVEQQTNDLMAELPRMWEDNVYDVVTCRLALEHIKKSQPRAMFIGLGETDEWAHFRRYDCYLETARRNDRFLRTLWETVQSMPQYAGKTTLIVSTDHGRGWTPADWINHSSDTPGAERIWIAVIGPDTPSLGVRRNVYVTQGQIAATIAAAVGEDFRSVSPKAAPVLPRVIEPKEPTKNQ
jgi:hypothetical protein